MNGSERNLVAPKSPQPHEVPGVLSDWLIPGFVAGTAGGALMAVLAVAYAWIFAGRPLEPLQLVAGLFFRDPSLAGMGPGAAALGLAVHMGVATGVGVAFAVLLPRGHTAVGAIGLGFLFALGLYVVMGQIIVPFASPPLDAHLEPLPFFGLHVAFGACLPLVASTRNVLHKMERLREKLGRWFDAPAHV